MTSISELTAQQLHAAASLKDRIESLQRELERVVQGNAAFAKADRRKLSPRAIANIRAGVRKRVAAMRNGQRHSGLGKKPKRKMSAAGRAAISAAAKARWKKAKAAGNTHL